MQVRVYTYGFTVYFTNFQSNIWIWSMEFSYLTSKLKLYRTYIPALSVLSGEGYPSYFYDKNNYVSSLISILIFRSRKLNFVQVK